MSDVGYNVDSVGGCEFRKLLHENPGLEVNLFLTIFRTFPLIFGMSCTGVELKPQSHGTQVRIGKKSAILILSVSKLHL